MAYLTVFPVQGGMRANLFVYWGMEDARLRKFRHQPKEAIASTSSRRSPGSPGLHDRRPGQYPPD